MKYVLCSILLLAGCSQTPSHFILAPGQQDVSTSNQLSSQLKVSDLRAYQYLVKTTDKNGQSELVNTSESASQVIKSSLAANLHKKNLKLNGVNYQVNIVKLMIDVAQHSIKFESNSKIELQVIVANESTTLSKTFRRNGNSYGPFSADLATLERDFNLLLGQMLDDIASDSELNNLLTP